MGHTQSDLFVVLEDPAISWCGDLVWNGLVPNYMDAIPSNARHRTGRRALNWLRSPEM